MIAPMTYEDTNGDRMRWDETLRQWVPVTGSLSPAELANEINPILSSRYAHRFVATGGYLAAPSGGVSTTVSMGVGTCYFIPFDFGYGHVLSKMGLEVTTGVSSSVIRLGVATMGLDGKPAVLVGDAGTVSAASATEVEVTGLSIACPTGWGYVVAVCQVAGSPSVRGVSSTPTSIVAHTSVTQAVRTNNAAYTQTVSGALPSSFSVGTSNVGTIPSVALYFSS